ncbi:aldehyde dehydrogenase family protein [Citricoccus sp. SGAir0253]|uniref:bifunctional proline dehydrogenase/L-glutamate gamma-semialdehyde dehydrogenase n=1 Tax=Citricoccus sp. SGAir0253 TaxID=2567881 RepID=UPI0010CCD5A7|nr:bifunctional proline dehydrogenase/L-glutamate gamma-semialdehyde dehydrogenase [Citricoccus sp. SGAir0253]QCU77206.1 aldehyde dehydrogenase family protein [Citricoccus sp. SGAir0253]
MSTHTTHSVIPDPAPLRDLAPAAVEQVRAWLREARNHPATFSARQLAGVLKDPAGLDFTVGFVDRVVRPEDPAIAARALSDLAPRTPPFLPWPMRAAMGAGGRLAPAVPGLAVPAARTVLRELVSHLIVDASEDKLGPAIARLRDPGTRLNINLLGEAILGRAEAERRMAGIRTLIERDDVDYVSVKVSAATAPHAAWAFDEAVEEITESLRPLYELAAAQHGQPGHPGPTFINLDMEEYHDLDLTLAVFMRLMDTPSLRGLPAGIVLQAYLPDALDAMVRLQEFAAHRVAAGGAPIKVRVVKGANLPMEHVQSSLTGWPAATYGSKQATDTNYKRVLNYALTPEHVRNVRIGVAGHNLFDIALAWLLVRDRGLSTSPQGERAADVEFEMLLGMATGQAEAVKKDVGSLLLYTPVVHPHEFDVAIAYLVRRLEEGASQENFMSAVFELDSDPALFAREEARFLASVADVDTTVPTPARTQDRRAGVPGPVPEPVDGFANTPDTDPSLAANREWARRITAAIPGSRLGVDEVAAARLGSPQEVRDAVGTAAAAGERWRTLSGAERERVLRAVADELEARRAELLEVAAAETGKTLDQGDPEVSEAVDFARYYGRLARGLDEVPGARFEPSRLVVVIPPWNFPVAIPTGGVLAGLAAGAPVVFKPAAPSARTGAVVHRAVVEGLRSGLTGLGWDAREAADVAGSLVRFVTIDRQDEATLGRELISHPDVERVILTGSYETARRFRSFRPDLPLLAETSGKNAIIVTPSADLDLAARDVVHSAFGHAGQKCSASSLVVLVGSVATSRRFHRQLLDAAASLTVGYPEDPRSQVGPVIQVPGEKLERGLTQLGPGEHWALQPQPLDETGRLWSPGIRAGVRPGSDAHLTEYFGPVLGVMTAGSLEEAVELVNAVDYGLTSGLHSLEDEEIDYWLEHVHAGNLYVNRGITGAIVRRQPFGGWKRSAVGAGTKAGGPHYLHGLGTWVDAPETSAGERAVSSGEPDAAAVTASGSPSGTPAGAPSTGAAEGDLPARLLAAVAEDLDDRELAWLERAVALDAAAWEERFGVARDVSGLMAERNLLRYRPVPVLIRWESGPLVHLLRVLAAGLRAGGPVTLSTPEPLAAEALDVLVEEGAPVDVQVESAAAFHSRARQLADVPPSAEGGGDPRVRLVLDWGGAGAGAGRAGGAEEADELASGAARAAVVALHEAVDGSPDLAVYAGPVVSAADVELLPFVHEQAVSITAHRFGTPDGLTDHLL